VEEGYMALRVLAVVAAFTVLFSLAPTYLKYVQHNRLLFGTTIGTAVVQIVLLALLIPRFGATGAATAYAVSICGMYGVFAWRARRELEVLRADGAAST
jgi:O-antigen/teichoic acid export membrane protein